jgi:hypothetical protein
VQRIGPVFSIVPVIWRGEVGTGGGTPGSPVSQAPEIVWSNATTTEAIDEDVNGNAITTVNGEPIYGATRMVPDLVLSVSRNYLLFSPWLTWNYLESTNSDSFVNFPPGVAKFMSFNARQTVSNGLTYWRVNATIQFRYPYRTTPLRAWWARVRHEGYLIKNDAGKLVEARDEHQQPVSRPVLLDDNGEQIVKVGGAFPPANWREFQIYTQLPYNALGLV